MKKLMFGLTTIASSSLAHVKPFEHGHVGFLHTEEILAVGIALAVAGAGLFLALKWRAR